MGRSSKSTINDIIKLIECDRILAFIGLGAAAGCHGNCVFHTAPQIWFAGIKRREEVMNLPNVLALQRTDEFFFPESHPWGLFHPLFLGQAALQHCPSSPGRLLPPTLLPRCSPTPLLGLGWAKPRLTEKGSRERGEDSPAEPHSLCEC